MRTPLTPTQTCIMDKLADGAYHSAVELHGCLNDEMTDLVTLRVHLVYLRRRIKERGLDIRYDVRARAYRQVRIPPT